PARRAEHVAYWTRRLAEAPAATGLGSEAVAAGDSRRREQVSRRLTAAEQAALGALARRTEASEREVLLSALLASLARVGNRRELLIGASPRAADPAREGLGRVRPLLPL